VKDRPLADPTKTARVAAALAALATETTSFPKKPGFNILEACGVGALGSRGFRYGR
jgi:hypothetical protein